MPQLLEKIVELQRAIDALSQADERLNGVPDWMSELHAEHSERKTGIEALNETIEGADRERREIEAGVADAKERLERYQGQLSQVTTQREYGALLQEIDTAKDEITRLEEEDKAAVERKSQAETELEEANQGFSELDKKYSAELKKWEAQKPAVSKEADALRASIEALREDLPRPYLVQFDRIAERHGGQALAAVKRLVLTGKKGSHLWHCGACHYNVRPQVVVELAAGTHFLLCDSCKRILFSPEEDVEEAEA